MRVAPLLLAAGCALAQPAFALNILLSNDDGYRHPNIRALYSALKADGHTVRIAAPYSDQSARGGAFFFGRQTQVGQDDDPAYPDSYYLTTTEKGLCETDPCAGKQVDIRISGTPVMAVLLGLEKILPHPDLVIVGPNPGNNLGALNSASGTFNAASVAVLSGVPALAVSADLKEQDSPRIAAIVTRLVDALDQHRLADGALLPKGVGLNLNLPPLEKLQGARLTRIGSYVPFHALYTEDLGKLDAQLAGKPGIGFAWSPPPDASNAEDEAVWVAKGYLTLSPFNALPGAPADSERLGAALTPLLGQATLTEQKP